MRRFLRNKFILFLVGTLASLTLYSVVKADTSTADSSTILQSILTTVNNMFSAYTTEVSVSGTSLSPQEAAIAIGLADASSSSPSPNIISNLQQYYAAQKTSDSTQSTLQSTLLSGFLGSGSSSTDLTFQAGGVTQNYMKNISSLNITHLLPSSRWTGTTNDINNYNNYINTASAAQTFNAYIISKVYSDQQASLSSKQQSLAATVTDPTNWFAQILAEPIGVVLRQILLFISQIFVLQLQQVQLMQTMIETQATTNTLLAAGNMSTESLLLSKAKQAPPSQ